MQHRRTAVLLGTLVLVSAACSSDATKTIAPPEGIRAIVNGEPTGSAYGNVGALLFDYDKNGISGDDEWCTGSLISPTVFLTAAHCIVTPYTPPGTQFYVSFSSDLYSRSFRYIEATGVVYDPEYGHDVAKLHDLAVVFLAARSTRGITPLQLPPAGYLGQLSAQGALSKALFVNVGYGTSSTKKGPPSFAYDGLRKFSKSEFMGLQPTWLGLLMNESATGQGGDCYGDSGGPKFLDGNPNMVLATVTTGDYPCRATTWDWRLDTPEARGFLGKYVTLP